jgi:hypothetical protein
VKDLHEWLAEGGFLPNAWRSTSDGRHYEIREVKL